MIYYLRQNSFPALHVICGGLNNVCLENGFLIIEIEDDYIFNMLNEQQNLAVLKRALNSQDLHIDLLLKKQEKIEDPISKDLKKLQSILGDYLIIKGE